MSKPLLSIIIPAYNAEKYIEKCIDSILQQDFSDYEIIVVNDGSKDSTLNLLQKYSTNHRIIIISKENGGVSSARNSALSKAKGEWIFFVDADDYVLPDAFQSFYNELVKHPGSDIYIFGYKIYFPNKTAIVTFNDNTSTDVLQLYHTLHDTHLSTNAYLWHKFFRSDIIINNHISFCQALSFSEDGVFWFHYAKYINSYHCSNKLIYAHIEGISTSLTKKHLDYDVLFNTFMLYKDCLREQTNDMAWFLENKFMAWLVQPWCLDHTLISYNKYFTRRIFLRNKEAIEGICFTYTNNRVIRLYQDNSYYLTKIYQWVYYKVLLFKANHLKKIMTKLKK